MNPFYYSRKFFTKKQVKRIVSVLIISLAFNLSGINYINGGLNRADASVLKFTQSFTSNNAELNVVSDSPESAELVELAEEEELATLSVEYAVKSTRVRTVSAYNAGDIYQTDDTPCIAANGEDICVALEMGYKRCAANFVPFGTILRIEGHGDCLVVDRMNKRYPDSVDIAMSYDQKQEALEWGRRRVTVSILEPVQTETELAVQ